MQLPTLYSRTSTGAVQQWTVEVQGSKYRSISGQVDGKKVTAEWTQAESKNVGRANETTPEAQAMLEAKAKWKKQTETGYHENIKDIDKSSYIEPMLAKKYLEELKKKKVTFPCYSQPKLDGIRCIVTKDRMTSRNGKDFVAVPHIRKALDPLFQKDPDLIFDGELYTDKLKNNFNKITSLVKKVKPTPEELSESAEKVQYWVYDLPSHPGNFSERYSAYNKLLFYFSSNCILPVQSHICFSEEEIEEHYEEYLAEGVEGLIVRLDGPYEFKRSRNLLKRKEFFDEEFVLEDFTEGVGKMVGKAARAHFTAENGKPFEAGVNGTFEELEEMFRNKKSYIGKQVTVRYPNKTPDGVPRFGKMVAVRDYE